MANTYENSFISQWNDEVHLAYQQKVSKWREAVRVVTGVKGSTHKFHTLGAITANSKSAVTAEVTLLEPAHAVKTATLADKYAPTFIDDLDALKTNADFRREYVQLGAAALGRAVDDAIITVLDAATMDTGNTITADDGVTYAKLLDGINALNADEVDPEERYFILSSKALAQALAISQFTSADYMAVRNVLNGTIQSALGLKWIMSNRLNLNVGSAGANYRACYMVNKQAVGLAFGQDISTRIDYVPMRVGHLIVTKASFGAVVIDTKGVVRLNIDET